MATTETNSTELGYADTLWKSADTLRGQIDAAILAVERNNPNLKGKLPRDYARRGIAPLFEMHAISQLESRKLSEFRDDLLPTLFSGAVRVKAAERVLETTP
ncbi:hypothetical protein ABC977_15985 [Thioalkalicoccus limnaeus]|uniref:Site-specific DNA-methyltransferase (adenine-specific) n=1 Tax=Thioalkalicoccus limnaeus TaxID=120681 RepID=A0ABV4BHA9_9GAMM